MAYNNLQSLQVQVDAGIAHLTLNHPPINLFDDVMSKELDQLTRDLERDPQVRVVILQSQIPEYFIAHSGLARVAAGPKDTSHVSGTPTFRLSQIIGERFRNMPKVVIAKVEGRARGGGNEVVLAADMCFAARDTAIFGQPEIMVGLVPGGGSTQRLPALIGRARAMEVLLGGEDVSATTAEQFGWINRAMDAKELGPFVESLARRIASFPPHAVAHIKAAVNRGAQASLPAGLLAEAHESDLCVASDVTRSRVSEGLGLGMETFEGELDLPVLAAKMSPS
ncbi:hypothetical protein M409DRAFT_18172 [Zasmidium cellare ATCC 36951]|uniref:Enoyl-CoA hydratase n=1 Tax=Zasmidium cellare ATCC 36951 TaxID=1080233 RepID=A0A6A6CXX0_ZASCE|nr:uncharacterized protein M409DRAFT_18172 [Zasmidium cellare ATCC 36951]KAF2171941.1 hypothetical protein M409DRAFT_18172 [Zasmidium cellare ATCC 36951]